MRGWKKVKGEAGNLSFCKRGASAEIAAPTATGGGYVELMGQRVARRGGGKRGPMSRLQQQIAAIEQLPKTKQQFVSQMLETVLAQAQH